MLLGVCGCCLLSRLSSLWLSPVVTVEAQRKREVTACWRLLPLHPGSCWRWQTTASGSFCSPARHHGATSAPGWALTPPPVRTVDHWPLPMSVCVYLPACWCACVCMRQCVCMCMCVCLFICVCMCTDVWSGDAPPSTSATRRTSCWQLTNRGTSTPSRCSGRRRRGGWQWVTCLCCWHWWGSALSVETKTLLIGKATKTA